jgi:CRISPR system Cascade subunit CasE
MHQRIMSLVPDGLGNQPRRQAGVLYRIEDTQGGVGRILVQTAIQPNLGKLPAGDGKAQVRDLSPLREGALVCI